VKIALLLLIASPLTAQGTLTPFQQQKARALLAAKLPCLGCHELDGDGGRSAPSLTTVGARRSADYIRRMVENPQSALRGAAMPRTTMPEAERDLIVRFLSSDALAPGKRGAVAGERSANAPPAPPALSKAASAPAAPDGEALYGRWCANCHGALGHGDGPNAKYLPVTRRNWRKMPCGTWRRGRLRPLRFDLECAGDSAELAGERETERCYGRETDNSDQSQEQAVLCEGLAIFFTDTGGRFEELPGNRREHERPPLFILSFAIKSRRYLAIGRYLPPFSGMLG